MRDMPRWTRRPWARRWWILALVALALVATVGYELVAAYPSSRSANLRNEPVVQTALPTMMPKDQVAFEQGVAQNETDTQIKIATGILTLLTGIAAGAAGVIAWRNLRATQAKLEIDRESQITDRFTKAIDQLGATKDGKPSLEIRLGGIYALERIARDSPRDHWTIMEVLTAYVRENVPVGPSKSSSSQDGQIDQQTTLFEKLRLRTDIQAVLTVLGRRIRTHDPQGLNRLDLSWTDLDAADLSEAHLERANLIGVHLRNSDLTGTHLDEADLEYAHLEFALLVRTYLNGATLGSANLARAILSVAQLDGTDLKDADLTGAFLQDANLRNARLDGTDLKDADLTNAMNLSKEQVYSAKEHGFGAFLDWPADWCDQFEKANEAK